MICVSQSPMSRNHCKYYHEIDGFAFVVLCLQGIGRSLITCYLAFRDTVDAFKRHQFGHSFASKCSAKVDLWSERGEKCTKTGGPRHDSQTFERVGQKSAARLPNHRKGWPKNTHFLSENHVLWLHRQKSDTHHARMQRAQHKKQQHAAIT